MAHHNPAEQFGGPVRPTPIPVTGVPPISQRPGSIATPSQQRRPRKDRGPNWLPQEVFVLIRAKRDLHLQKLDSADARDLMIPDSNKWMRISNLVMGAGFSPCVCNGAACKTKWHQLMPDYKRIVDYMGRSGQNVPDFWELTSSQRKAGGLPGHFPQDFFDAIHEWFGSRPQVNPLHVRDKSSPDDSNFQRPTHDQHQGQDDNNDSETETEDPMDMAERTVPLCSQNTSSQSSPVRSSSGPACRQPLRSPSSSSLPTAFTTVVPAMSPVIISSSDTTQRRPGNTAIRRKNISGHTIIADATKATGAIMASQMKDIADAALQVERSKIEVQMKLFCEQMAYQREKDRRLQETALATHANVRLAILKQSDMVHCLTELTAVLGRGLHGSSRVGEQRYASSSSTTSKRNRY